MKPSHLPVLVRLSSPRGFSPLTLTPAECAVPTACCPAVRWLLLMLPLVRLGNKDRNRERTPEQS